MKADKGSSESTHTQHVVARNNGMIVLAQTEALESKSKTDAKTYICHHCNSQLVLRRTTHLRYNVSGYFAHKNISTCTGGSPESAQHLQAKFWLKHFVGHYSICLQKCVCCGPYLGFESKPSDCVHVELPHNIDGKRYIYDTVVAREGKCALVIEVFHTHKTEEHKIQAVHANGMKIAEVKADTVLKMVAELEVAKRNGTRVQIPNLLTADIECAECRIKKQQTRAANAMKQAQAEFDREGYYDLWFVWTTTINEDADNLYSDYCAAYYEWMLQISLKQRRHLQKRGFELAFEKKQLKQRKTRKPTAFHKTNKKCFKCEQWFPRSGLYELPSDLWTIRQYKDIHAWYHKRGLRLPVFALGCDDCTIHCQACGYRFPLDHAERYGLCFPCNLKSL